MPNRQTIPWSGIVEGGKIRGNISNIPNYRQLKDAVKQVSCNLNLGYLWDFFN
ncbi:hypothetical protein IQ247_23900 [Plectonema cf. radiosum LEGE 06105]|uniref:Uncharacterized protein n=1 Tax=Plectonema cf. radiosum LEGE 06105 TaxID=945769 RepID=A0A8J7K3C5_9CYAN|nr:hypothetical protein [Plectonema radiosum]MBE9215671.1 hypothetical protein [Plectonema cf. radiosum LEGE 06105]